MGEGSDLKGEGLINAVMDYFNYYSKTKKNTIPAMDAALRTVTYKEKERCMDTSFEKVKKNYFKALKGKGWTDNITLWPYAKKLK